MLHPERVDFTEPISTSEIDYLVSDPKIDVLQCSTPIKEATWILLNNEFFRRRPEVELRVFSKVTDKLTGLLLGTTRSKKPDLSPLNRFGKLTRIYLDGQQKNIDVLCELNLLEDVTLRSITTPDLHYLNRLQHMWSLDIKLGGIRGFSAIEGMQRIKYLELWQVRGLNDIDFITTLPGLQNLMLQSLPLITALPSFREMRKLRRITLNNLKGLRDFSELQWSPALEEFVLIEGQLQQPEDLLPVLRNPALCRVWTNFGSIRKEQRFKELLHDHGIDEYVGYHPFNYL